MDACAFRIHAVAMQLQLQLQSTPYPYQHRYLYLYRCKPAIASKVNPPSISITETKKKCVGSSFFGKMANGPPPPVQIVPGALAYNVRSIMIFCVGESLRV